MNASRRSCSSRESAVEQDSSLQHTVTSLLRFLQILLDCAVLGLERQDDPETLRNLVESTECLVGSEDDQLHEHEVTQHPDFMFIAEAGDHPVEQISGVDAGNGSFHEGVQSLVCALVP